MPSTVTQLAEISTEISNISSAVYGRQVRQSIVSALNKMNANTISGFVSAQEYANNAAESADDAYGYANAASNSATSAASALSDVNSAASAAETSATAAANSASAAQAAAEALETGVASFNGRTGLVVPVVGDYSSDMITHDDTPLDEIVDEIEGDLYVSSSMFKIEQRAINVSAIAANGTYNADETFTISGKYECLGIVGYTFSSSWLFPTKVYASSGNTTYDSSTNVTTQKAVLRFRSANSSQVNASTFTYWVLFHKIK